MPKRIKKLTDEQIARMPEWVDRWIKVGHCTDEADWEAFELGARECYAFAHLPWHGRVIRVGNPLVGALAVQIASAWLGANRDTVNGAVVDAVVDAVRGAVGDAVVDAVDDAVRGAVVDAVRGAVDVAVVDAVDVAVRDAVGDAVDVAVRGAVVDAVVDAVRDAVGDAVRGAVRGGWWRFLGGHLWSSWQAYTSFFRDVCGLDLPGDLWDCDRAYALAQSSAGWWWPYRDFVVVSDRPAVLHVDQFRPGRWRMHCDTGPAIAYRDGWGLWFLEGINVEQHVVERPDTITLDEISGERNAEKRRILTQQYGLLRYFRDLGAKPLDSRFGEALFRDPKNGWGWLVCTDGSTGRIYQIRVPDRCETVTQAQTALNGVDPSLMLARS